MFVITRTIRYAAETPEDLEEHLDRTLMSIVSGHVEPGTVHPGIGPLFSSSSGPRLTIDLVSETEMREE